MSFYIALQLLQFYIPYLHVDAFIQICMRDVFHMFNVTTLFGINNIINIVFVFLEFIIICGLFICIKEIYIKLYNNYFNIHDIYIQDEYNIYYISMYTLCISLYFSYYYSIFNIIYKLFCYLLISIILILLHLLYENFNIIYHELYNDCNYSYKKYNEYSSNNIYSTKNKNNIIRLYCNCFLIHMIIYIISYF
jgi:hypothetical protein